MEVGARRASMGRRACTGADGFMLCCAAGDIPEVQLVPQDVKMTVQPIVVIQVRR